MSAAVLTESTMKPRRLPKWTWAAVAGASAATVGLGAIAAGGLNPLAALALTGLLYLVVMTGASWIVEGRRWGTNTLVTTLVVFAFIAVMIPLVSLVWTVAADGIKALSWDFFTEDMKGVRGGEAPGIGHAILGTLWVTLLASAISVPLGILTAVYLVEYGRGWVARTVTFLTDVMTGIPSIVAGLFAFTLISLLFGPRYQSAAIGAIALSLLMTPVVIRSVEEMLRLVPNDLREAAYALGVPKWLTIIKVVLRTAVAGITTGVMIAVARVIGETAPLLLTVKLATAYNLNPFDGAMATLPVFVYDRYNKGQADDLALAWGGALTLIIIVMLLNLVARLISRAFSPKGAR
ncbi:phosphate ABC transporter permease PstA [Buchananella felis]|uniref:phosphate ABC transporter permease PstA n=1 Tax=Buchananella felis TaxID=3231492 RepID=UPI003529B240